MRKLEIKHHLTGEVLFEYEKEDNTIKDTLMEAIKKGVDLRNADLCCYNLRGINLCDVDLFGVNLSGSDLTDADLSGSNLCGAYMFNTMLHDTKLCYTDLIGVHLYGSELLNVNFYDIDLCGVVLRDVGKIEDWVCHDNVGSRKARTIFFKTDKGVFVQCGCFFGDLEKFVTTVKERHKGNEYEKEYLSLVEYIKIRFKVSF